MPIILKSIATIIAVFLGLHALLSIDERGWWSGPSNMERVGALTIWIAMVAILWTT